MVVEQGGYKYLAPPEPNSTRRCGVPFQPENIQATS